MGFKSYKKDVLKAMEASKKEFCQRVGILVEGEAKSLAPVDNRPNAPHPGNLRRSITHEVMPNNEGVNIGVTPNAKYGLWVEKGIGQPAQPYLEPGALNSIPKLSLVAKEVYKRLDGDA